MDCFLFLDLFLTLYTPFGSLIFEDVLNIMNIGGIFLTIYYNNSCQYMCHDWRNNVSVWHYASDQSLVIWQHTELFMVLDIVALWNASSVIKQSCEPFSEY